MSGSNLPGAPPATPDCGCSDGDGSYYTVTCLCCGAGPGQRCVHAPPAPRAAPPPTDPACGCDLPGQSRADEDECSCCGADQGEPCRHGRPAAPAEGAPATTDGMVCTSCGKPAPGVGAALDPSHVCAAPAPAADPATVEVEDKYGEVIGRVPVLRAPAADPDPDFALKIARFEHAARWVGVSKDGTPDEADALDLEAEARSALVTAWEALRAERDDVDQERRQTRDMLFAARAEAEGLARLLREVLPETMGGYPDLFAPAGGWKAWEDRARALAGPGADTAGSGKETPRG